MIFQCLQLWADPLRRLECTGTYLGHFECIGTSLGWTITLVILIWGAIYVGGGVAWGRNNNTPDPDDGALAHPEGKGILGWHPHHSAWGEGWALIMDGGRFVKMKFDRWRNGGVDDYDRIQSEREKVLDQQYEQDLVARRQQGLEKDVVDSRNGSSDAREKKKKTEKKKRKKRTNSEGSIAATTQKPRPRTSLPNVGK